MRVSIHLVVCALASLVSFAIAQDLSKLPQCARDCVGTSLSTTGCQSLDITCICQSQSWIANLSCCIAKTCNPQDQDTTIQFADSFCKTAGVTLPTAASCLASAGPTSTGSGVASYASAVGGTSPSATLGGSLTSSSAASNTVLSGTNSASTISASSTGTPVTAAASAASASPATAAANTHGAELGLLGLAAALFAMV